jgi:uncharacterized protein
MELLNAYILLGVFAGTMAGLLGVGGGLLIVPVLLYLWQPSGLGAELAMPLAIGTSLAVIVFTSLSSVLAHHRRGAVLWSMVGKLTPGILVGTLLGALLATATSAALLKIIFALFEWFVAAQMFFTAQRSSAHGEKLGMLTTTAAGTFIGSVSALVGIGGGTLTVPFLNACKLSMRQAIGSSSACGVPIAIGGALSYLYLGWGHNGLPEMTWGYIYAPAMWAVALSSVVFAPIGAALAHRLATSTLKKIFAGFLMLLGAWMFLSAF